MMSSQDSARSIFVVGLSNTHALENEALQVMNRQVERLQHYPDLEQALRRHIAETEQQRVRLEEIMSQLGESPSTLKETFFATMGNMAAMAHAAAQDEIIKNMLANHALENYEIAAYLALIEMAEAAGYTATTGLHQSLREEQLMAQTVHDLVAPITRKYILLTQQDATAKR